jgi:hypothetical protein
MGEYAEDALDQSFFSGMDKYGCWGEDEEDVREYEESYGLVESELAAALKAGAMKRYGKSDLRRHRCQCGAAAKHRLKLPHRPRELRLCKECFKEAGGHAADIRRLKPCRMMWESRDGKRIRVCSMPDSHLLNAILYVERNAYLLQANELVGLMSYVDRAPDSAADTAGNALAEVEEETPEEFLVRYMPYRKLYNEARRRRLVLVPVTSWFSQGYDAPLPVLEG